MLGKRQYLEIISHYDRMVIQIRPWFHAANKLISAIEKATKELAPVLTNKEQHRTA